MEHDISLDVFVVVPYEDPQMGVGCTCGWFAFFEFGESLYRANELANEHLGSVSEWD